MKPFLRHARGLIAGGWSEPFNLNGAGAPVLDPLDEGLARFSVDGALREAARCQRIPPEQLVAAWDLLEAIAAPAFAAFRDAPTPEAMVTASRLPGVAVQLQDWLEARGRRLGEVLAVFDAAILKGAR